MPFTTPLFTANQGLEIDDFNRRRMPTTKQQDKFEKRVYDPIAVLTKQYEKEDLPHTSKYLTRPKLKKILGTKPPIVYKSPIKADTREVLPPYGRTVSSMPEPPSQRHSNCFNPNYEPSPGEHIDALWIQPTVAYGSLNANTQQRILEEKQEACMKKFQPRKWKMDIHNKIQEDKLKKDVATKMKEFGAGFQLPFVPCERATRIRLRSNSEIWRQMPNRPSGEDETGEKFKLLMSKLHNEELWTQKMMESTASLEGEGNRIRNKCARQEYNTRPLGTMTSWHTDILSRWSQLHGFAIPHLQTLPENLRKKKAMADAALSSPGKTTIEPPKTELPEDELNYPGTELQSNYPSDEPEFNVDDSALTTHEKVPPPPGNTPLPPVDEPPRQRASEVAPSSKPSVPKVSQSAPSELSIEERASTGDVTAEETDLTDPNEGALERIGEDAQTQESNGIKEGGEVSVFEEGQDSKGGEPIAGPNEEPIASPNKELIGGPDEEPTVSPNEELMAGPNEEPIASPDEELMAGPNDRETATNGEVGEIEDGTDNPTDDSRSENAAGKEELGENLNGVTLESNEIGKVSMTFNNDANATKSILFKSPRKGILDDDSIQDDRKPRSHNARSVHMEDEGESVLIEIHNFEKENMNDNAEGRPSEIPLKECNALIPLSVAGLSETSANDFILRPLLDRRRQSESWRRSKSTPGLPSSAASSRTKARMALPPDSVVSYPFVTNGTKTKK